MVFFGGFALVLVWVLLVLGGFSWFLSGGWCCFYLFFGGCVFIFLPRGVTVFCDPGRLIFFVHRISYFFGFLYGFFCYSRLFKHFKRLQEARLSETPSQRCRMSTSTNIRLERPPACFACKMPAGAVCSAVFRRLRCASMIWKAAWRVIFGSKPIGYRLCVKIGTFQKAKTLGSIGSFVVRIGPLYWKELSSLTWKIPIFFRGRIESSGRAFGD